MNSKIITFADKNRWNEFASSQTDPEVLQSYEWGELKGCFGWQPIRIAVEDNGTIIAGVSILKREIPYLKHCLFYAPRGPIVKYSKAEALHFLLSAIEKEADKQHAVSFKIDPAIEEDRKDVLDALHKIGFEKSSKQVQPRATILLDIRPDLETLLKSFEEKTRYNIRLSEKKGVVVREDKSEQGVAAFYQLYLETAKRDNFIIHPLRYYQKIREIMLDNGLGTNFIAYHNDKPVGAVIVFNFGTRLWYMYGASASEARNVMPNHLLHWEIIKWAKEKNLQTYDLWGIPAKPHEKHPLWGVYRFKKGFKGKTVKYIGAYDFPYSHILYHGLELGLKLWQNFRSLISKGKIEDSLGE